MVTAAPLSFFVAMKPGVKGNSKKIVRFGKRFALIARPEDKAKEESLIARLAEFRPATPFTGSVFLEATFVMPIPSSFPAWKRAAALEGRVRPSKRPDRGNLLKLLEDAVEKSGFMLDDGQIVDGPVRKVYGEVPGYRVVLTPFEEPSAPTRRAKELAT